MTTEEKIDWIFAHCRTAAVVGLSPQPDRPGYYVSAYLQNKGFRIFPVRPGGGEILGESCRADLTQLKEEKIDLVLVFRKAEYVPEIVEKIALLKNVKALWMQEGIIHEPAARTAEGNGLLTVMDRCMLKEGMKRDASISGRNQS